MDHFDAAYADRLDSEDALAHLRNQFLIPSKRDLKRKSFGAERQQTGSNDCDPSPSIYLCGNSLGLQPSLTSAYMNQYLSTWATKGVYGHFTAISDSNLAPWLHVDHDLTLDMAALVGAQASEVAVMQTLTANLHLMLASFYRPEKGPRYKIILEGKAFPSDHYAVESQIRHHGLEPKDAMILIQPPSKDSHTIPTSHILSTIDAHASETALVLLPGVQFYTGQFFDMRAITAHARSKGIAVGWDLAHAVGNVPMQLHDWDVDFAVWCTYKYLNCGPGSIGGCFVHERHTTTSPTNGDGVEGGDGGPDYRPRLAGWWGSSKSSRFAMTNRFEPIPGAAGFQLSNPSVADTTAVRASLDVFKQTDMQSLRAKSLKLTGYLEDLLDNCAAKEHIKIITPRNETERGAQLSVLLKPGLLDSVMHQLEQASVVVDERRPDVIRVAPAPLYNNFSDVLMFVHIFSEACEKAANKRDSGESVMLNGGKKDKGWSEIK